MNPKTKSTNQKACIIYSYPQLSEHGMKILDRLKETLDEQKVNYTLIDLYSKKFDPVMSGSEVRNYGHNTNNEIKEQQKILTDSNTWYILYPVWWATPPAILKGYIDRVFTPGFAFSSSQNGPIGLLQKKRVLVIRTFSSSASEEADLGYPSHLFMEKTILGYCGIKAQYVDIFSIDSLADTAFNHNLLHIASAARRLLTRPEDIPHHLRSVPAPHLPPLDRPEPAKDEKKQKEKPELNDKAKEDLDYFRNASKRKRRAVRDQDYEDSDFVDYIAGPKDHQGKNKYKKKKRGHNKNIRDKKGKNKKQRGMAGHDKKRR